MNVVVSVVLQHLCLVFSSSSLADLLPIGSLRPRRHTCSRRTPRVLRDAMHVHLWEAFNRPGVTSCLSPSAPPKIDPPPAPLFLATQVCLAVLLDDLVYDANTPRQPLSCCNLGQPSATCCCSSSESSSASRPSFCSHLTSNTPTTPSI